MFDFSDYNLLVNTRSSKLVLVLLAQILGPFGPLQARKFRQAQKTSKVCTLYFDPQSLNQIKLLLPYCVLFLNFVSPPSCLVPQASSANKFFGPPGFWSSYMSLVLQALVNFKDRE